MKRRYSRGYPVAILIGIENDKSVIWNIFSKVVKPLKSLYLDGERNDTKALYNFHESIINALKSTLDEGTRSIILASPTRTNNTQLFIDHIHIHHIWLIKGPNKVIISKINGSARKKSDVVTLTKTPLFHKLIYETTLEETENLIELLDKYLNSSDKNKVVLYSIMEIEDLIFNTRKPPKLIPEYLMLVNKYLFSSPEKNRIQKMIQIAKNNHIKTKIFNAETNAGQRLLQFGGIVCLAYNTQN
jgi:stalled ribosome rescue protein Dom34